MISMIETKAESTYIQKSVGSSVDAYREHQPALLPSSPLRLYLGRKQLHQLQQILRSPPLCSEMACTCISGVESGQVVTRTPASFAALRLGISVYIASQTANAALFPFFAMAAGKKTDSHVAVGALLRGRKHRQPHPPLTICLPSIA